MMNDPTASHPQREIPRISYAQNREDILLDRLFGDHVGRYMDVGACHPVHDSNTQFFHERGWRGVNLEPGSTSFRRFVEQRPEDLNLNLGASDFDGEVSFYEVDDNGISTVSPDLAGRYRERGIEVVERRVPVATIRSLIDAHGIEPPDFLSIDVEGHEAAVIRGTPLETWRPRVLVVEATRPLTTTPSHQDWEPILLEQGYLLAAFNGVNRFYLREDLRDRLDLFATPVHVLDDFVPYEVVLEREHAADLERRLAVEQDLMGIERRRYEEAHRDWERDREAWERDRDAWEQERCARDGEREQWRAHLAEFGAEQAGWRAHLAEFEVERARWQARLIEFEAEQAEWAGRRADLEQHRDGLQRQLEATQRLLRPYRLLDGLGVVTVGYGWARKLKHRLVS